MRASASSHLCRVFAGNGTAASIGSETLGGDALAPAGAAGALGPFELGIAGRGASVVPWARARSPTKNVKANTARRLSFRARIGPVVSTGPGQLEAALAWHSRTGQKPAS